MVLWAAAFLLAVGLCVDALAAGKVTIDFWGNNQKYVRVRSDKNEGIVLSLSLGHPQYAPWDRNGVDEWTTITGNDGRNPAVYVLFEKLGIRRDEAMVTKLQKFLIDGKFLNQNSPDGDFGAVSWMAFIKAAQSGEDLRRDLEELLTGLASFKKDDAKAVAKWSWGSLGDFPWVGLVSAVLLIILTGATVYLFFVFPKALSHDIQSALRPRLERIDRGLGSILTWRDHMSPQASEPTTALGTGMAPPRESSVQELEKLNSLLIDRCKRLRAGLWGVASKLGQKGAPPPEQVTDDLVIRDAEGRAVKAAELSSQLDELKGQLSEREARINALVAEREHFTGTQKMPSKVSDSPEGLRADTSSGALSGMDRTTLDRMSSFTNQYGPLGFFGFLDAAIQSLAGIDSSEDSGFPETLRPLLGLRELSGELTAWREKIPGLLESVIGPYPASIDRVSDGVSGASGAPANGELLKLLREKLVLNFNWDRSISVVLVMDEFVRYYMVAHADKLRSSPAFGVKESEIRSAIASIKSLSERLHFAAVAICLFLKELGINPHELKIGEPPPGRGVAAHVERVGLERWSRRADLERAIGKVALYKILREMESGVVVDVSAWGYNIGGISKTVSKVVVNALSA